MPGFVSGLLAVVAPRQMTAASPARRRARRLRRGPRPPALARRQIKQVLVLASLGAAAISACGTSTVVTPKPFAVIRMSLATSTETSAGAWASVPMGHLEQPLNTFWQLFFRPPGARDWSNEASALAVATNGGLVVAAREHSLTVGIRPTNHLGYSPLIVTTDARSWSPAGPIPGLTDHPDSLAVDAEGKALALVGTSTVARVLESGKSLNVWHVLTSLRGLEATAAGRQCKLSSLSAVGYLGTRALVAGTCRRRGVVGIFARVGTAWALVGPRLPPSLGKVQLDLLGLEVVPGGLCALSSITRQLRAGLMAQCTSKIASSWRASGLLHLKGDDDTVSLGATSGPGLFVLSSPEGGPSALEVLDSTDMDWAALAPPPAGTVTAVFSSGGEVDALSVDNTLFTDWRLEAPGGTWKREQRLLVPIQFGSSG